MIWFLSLICFALPSYLIRFKIFGIPTTVLEVLIYLGILIQISKMFAPQNSLRNRKNQNDKLKLKNILNLKYNIIIPIGLFLLAAIISTVISPDKRVSLGILKGWVIDPILLFGLVVLSVKIKKDFRKIIFGLVGGGLIVSFWGILQVFGLDYLLPHQRIDPSFLSYLATHRAFGPFESPNYLGMYLAPIAALTLGYWLNLKLKIKNEKPQLKTQNSYLIFTSSYFLTFCLFAMLLALFFTKSFGAWLGFGAALLFLIWFYLSKEKRPAFWASLILILLIGFAIILKYKPQRILDSFAARKEVWQVSWYLIKKNPILGIGLGTFSGIYNKTIPLIFTSYPMNWIQMHPHNIFLAFWLNMGILGLSSFLWFLVKFFREIKYRLTNSSRAYTICWIGAMIAILTHGLLDTTYWKNDLSAIFWIVFGLALITSRKRQNENF